MIQLREVNYPRSLFYFLNSWLSIDGYKEVVEDAWKQSVIGTTSFVLKTKLKNVKLATKQWLKFKCSLKSQMVQLSSKLQVVGAQIDLDPMNET